MGKLFDLDSPVMRFLSRLADLMILNILVLITCTPIITIGASLSAMHYVLIKMIRNEENYIIKMYFKAFKDNFKKGTALWIIVMLVIGVFALDFMAMTRLGMVFPWVVVVGVFMVGVIVFMTVMYIFPLQARFENTVRATIKNAFLIMILNFPKSILMLLVYTIPVILILVSQYATPLLIMLGVSGPGLGAAYLYRKVFARFEPDEEEINDFAFSIDAEGGELSDNESSEE